jgi:hypothetical protein
MISKLTGANQGLLTDIISNISNLMSRSLHTAVKDFQSYTVRRGTKSCMLFKENVTFVLPGKIVYAMQNH